MLGNLACGSIAALALDPATPLANYGRQAWGMENGLPQNTVQALVQTQDGFIWLGTEVGLVRFDGNGFQVFDKNTQPALPGNDVRCLLATKDGALWIGTSDGLARWMDGAATNFTAKDGLPENGIQELGELPNGLLWTATDLGDAELQGGKFVAAGAVDSKLAGKHISLAVHAWDSIRGIVQQSGIPKDQIAFAQIAPNGLTAVASKSALAIPHGDIVTERFSVGHELPGSKIQVLFADREGAFWIGTNGGLARWVDGKLQLLPVTDPLATASVLSIMEDREGNIWAGTEAGGLHILRDQRFHTIGAREGLTSDATTTVVEGAAGKLWIGTSGGALNAIRRGEGQAGAATIYAVRDVLLSDVILSLAAAQNGDLWVGTPDGLNRIRGGSVDSFTSADGLPDDFIRSLLADADGSLWIGTRRGLAHWTDAAAATHSGGHIVTFTQSNGLGSDLVGAMARDANGDLWVATFAGLSRLHGGKIQNYTTADGLSSNVVTALLARKDGTLLIGTQDHGWNLWDGRRFQAAKGDGLDRTTIHAILDDDGGHLWFATANGIARCDCGSASNGMRGADCSHWMEFGAADGLRGRETATNSHPSAWRSRDGHLWFATPKGLVEVDPTHFPVNAVPPPVDMERFSVDDVDQPLHAPGSRVVVPSGHVHFQFDYAGLSFVAPQKVRYRYMLEGFDHGWTEAGTRRSAYYTAIPPGQYTFKV